MMTEVKLPRVGDVVHIREQFSSAIHRVEEIKPSRNFDVFVCRSTYFTQKRPFLVPVDLWRFLDRAYHADLSPVQAEVTEYSRTSGEATLTTGLQAWLDTLRGEGVGAFSLDQGARAYQRGVSARMFAQGVREQAGT